MYNLEYWKNFGIHFCHFTKMGTQSLGMMQIFCLKFQDLGREKCLESAHFCKTLWISLNIMWFLDCSYHKTQGRPTLSKLHFKSNIYYTIMRWLQLVSHGKSNLSKATFILGCRTAAAEVRVNNSALKIWNNILLSINL